VRLERFALEDAEGLLARGADDADARVVDAQLLVLLERVAQGLEAVLDELVERCRGERRKVGLEVRLGRLRARADRLSKVLEADAGRRELIQVRAEVLRGGREGEQVSSTSKTQGRAVWRARRVDESRAGREGEEQERTSQPATRRPTP